MASEPPPDWDNAKGSDGIGPYVLLSLLILIGIVGGILYFAGKAA